MSESTQVKIHRPAPDSKGCICRGRGEMGPHGLLLGLQNGASTEKDFGGSSRLNSNPPCGDMPRRAEHRVSERHVSTSVHRDPRAPTAQSSQANTLTGRTHETEPGRRPAPCRRRSLWAAGQARTGPPLDSRCCLAVWTENAKPADTVRSRSCVDLQRF